MSKLMKRYNINGEILFKDFLNHKPEPVTTLSSDADSYYYDTVVAPAMMYQNYLIDKFNNNTLDLASITEDTDAELLAGYYLVNSEYPYMAKDNFLSDKGVYVPDILSVKVEEFLNSLNV